MQRPHALEPKAAELQQPGADRGFFLWQLLGITLQGFSWCSYHYVFLNSRFPVTEFEEHRLRNGVAVQRTSHSWFRLLLPPGHRGSEAPQWWPGAGSWPGFQLPLHGRGRLLARLAPVEHAGPPRGLQPHGPRRLVADCVAVPAREGQRAAPLLRRLEALSSRPSADTKTFFLKNFRFSAQVVLRLFLKRTPLYHIRSIERVCCTR